MYMPGHAHPTSTREGAVHGVNALLTERLKVKGVSLRGVPKRRKEEILAVLLLYEGDYAGF